MQEREGEAGHQAVGLKRRKPPLPNGRGGGHETYAIKALKEHQKMVKVYRTLLGDDYQENMLASPADEGTPINPHNLYRTVLRLQRAINAKSKEEKLTPRESWTLHDLRRTFGTRIAQTRTNMKETSTLMGHARMDTAEKDGLREAVKKMRNRKGARIQDTILSTYTQSCETNTK